ncbi:MAG: type II secretion system secretin GspD [Pseudomonadota bacterium]
MTKKHLLISLILCISFISSLMPLDLWAQKADERAVRGSVRLPETQTPAEIDEEIMPKAAAEVAKPAPEEAAKGPSADEMVYLNVQDEDIKDIIRQISKATGKNFIIDDKVRGKVTIMSEKMMTKEEAYQAFLSALEVAGFTTVQGPGGIIKIISLKDAASSPVPTHVDSTPYTDSFVTRLISLNNISALEMSNAIKGLISKSGNMFAYPATNTLIITDSGTNIDRLMKIIKELDQEGPQQVLEIIPINYADATEVAQTVLNLFEIEQAQAATRRATPRRAAGAELEDIKDVSKIIADERTNSLIVLASKRAIDKVRDIIAKLDKPLEAADTGTIHVHYLKYANATDLASTLSAITSAAKTQATQATGAAKGAAQAVVAQLEGGINIGADDSTNALIITASAKDYRTLVDELISKLDIPRRQVYLEAIVMELEVFNRNQAGASGYAGAGSGSILGFGSTNFSDFSSVSGLFDPTSFFSTPGLLGGLLSRSNITIDVPSTGGGTTTLTIPSFAAFLNFLSTYRDANIVSTPNLMTLDNQKASIEVTRIQYANKTTQSGTTGFQTVEPYPLEAGLTLEITPQISEGDSVRLEIHHKLSNFTGDPGPTGAAPQTKREITTTVMAMDGQTVVLGGLMEDVVTHDKSKIPILGDIPILGWLFRSTRSSNSKSNLLVFITPHVLRDPTDFAEISKIKIEQRNAFIDKNYGKRQQRAIYDTIAMHRADLLAFTPQGTYRPPGTTEGAPSSEGPVITVPAVGTEPAFGGTVESSKTKPVTNQGEAVSSGGNLDHSY